MRVISLCSLPRSESVSPPKVNTSGVPRLTKFYTPLRSASQPLISKIFSLISSRPASLCNFLDAPELQTLLGERIGDEVRVVYRCYATLYFVFVVDASESELGILDLIQVCSFRKIGSFNTDGTSTDARILRYL